MSSPVFPVNGSLLMAPLFPRSGPGESGSPMSQVVLRCYDFPFTHPRSAVVVVCGDPTSYGGVVGTPNYRGIPLGQSGDIYRPRQRPSLRQRIHTPHPGHGHSGPAHIIPLALAERSCRTPDRIGPTRVHRSSDRIQRRTPAADPCEILHLLQRMASSCFARKGCAGKAPNRALRGHRRPCNLGRIASPVRTNLVFGSDTTRSPHRRASCHYPSAKSRRADEVINDGWPFDEHRLNHV